MRIGICRSTPIKAFQTCYSKHISLSETPKGYWKSVENQRSFFDSFGQKHGINSLDDWYSIANFRNIVKNGGTFLSSYNGSAIEALKACYPQHDWLPWKFKHLPINFWKSTQNQQMFFDWLGKQLNVQKLDDWYEKLSADVVKRHGGGGLLRYHKRSVVSALTICYPHHDWKHWRFEHCSIPRKFWNSPENLSQFLSELSNKLEIQTLDDWYRVDTLQLQNLGASHIIRRHGGLYQVLLKEFPHHPWNIVKFNTVKKAQKWLILALKKMFPQEDILEDYIYPEGSFQLDAFIPSQSLAFEFHGRQHYQDTGVFQPAAVYQQRDSKKRALCAKNNIKLIEVPYWWNRSQEELEKLIQKGHA